MKIVASGRIYAQYYYYLCLFLPLFILFIADDQRASGSDFPGYVIIQTIHSLIHSKAVIREMLSVAMNVRAGHKCTIYAFL